MTTRTTCTPAVTAFAAAAALTVTACGGGAEHPQDASSSPTPIVEDITGSELLASAWEQCTQDIDTEGVPDSEYTDRYNVSYDAPDDAEDRAVLVIRPLGEIDENGIDTRALYECTADVINVPEESRQAIETTLEGGAEFGHTAPSLSSGDGDYDLQIRQMNTGPIGFSEPRFLLRISTSSADLED